MATKLPSEREIKEVREALEKGPSARPLPKGATPVERTKFALCEEFVKYKNARHLTQRAIAEQVGIDEALMSKILHYQFEEFTTDRLIKFLSVIYPNVDLKVRIA